MKTILSVSACWLLLVFVHVEAVTDMDFQALLARLSVLEDKQAVIETENKLSQKRIADLEKYKKLTDRRVASLERTIALCYKKQDALEIVKNSALETDKILSDTTTTTNGYDKTLSDKGFASLDKDRLLSDRKIATLEKDYASSSNRSGKDESYSAAVEIEDLSTAELQSKHRRFVAEGAVAFSAMRDNLQEHVGENQNIIFERVITNEGGGYHPNHGVFIAPQSGFYVLSSSIMCGQNGEVIAAMVHNGNFVTRMYCHGDSGRHDQGSQTVVIKMNAGDEAAVQNIEHANNNIWGISQSSFSGVLVVLQ